MFEIKICAVCSIDEAFGEIDDGGGGAGCGRTSTQKRFALILLDFQSCNVYSSHIQVPKLIWCPLASRRFSAAATPQLESASSSSVADASEVTQVTVSQTKETSVESEEPEAAPLPRSTRSSVRSGRTSVAEAVTEVKQGWFDCAVLLSSEVIAVEFWCKLVQLSVSVDAESTESSTVPTPTPPPTQRRRSVRNAPKSASESVENGAHEEPIPSGKISLCFGCFSQQNVENECYCGFSVSRLYVTSQILEIF